MKKPVKAPTVEGSSFTCSDESFLKRYPALAAMLCDGLWDDRTPRLLCRLGVSMGGGTVTVSLSDENFQQSMYTDAQSVDKALKLMNDSLAAETASWRPWKAAGKRKT